MHPCSERMLLAGAQQPVWDPLRASSTGGACCACCQGICMCILLHHRLVQAHHALSAVLVVDASMLM